MAKPAKRSPERKLQAVLWVLCGGVVVGWRLFERAAALEARVTPAVPILWVPKTVSCLVGRHFGIR